MVKTPLCSAGDVGLIPQGTEIPNATEQLIIRATTKTQYSQINKHFFQRALLTNPIPLDS